VVLLLFLAGWLALAAAINPDKEKSPQVAQAACGDFLWAFAVN